MNSQSNMIDDREIAGENICPNITRIQFEQIKLFHKIHEVAISVIDLGKRGLELRT